MSEITEPSSSAYRAMFANDVDPLRCVPADYSIQLSEEDHRYVHIKSLGKIRLSTKEEYDVTWTFDQQTKCLVRKTVEVKNSIENCGLSLLAMAVLKGSEPVHMHRFGPNVEERISYLSGVVVSHFIIWDGLSCNLSWREEFSLSDNVTLWPSEIIMSPFNYGYSKHGQEPGYFYMNKLRDKVRSLVEGKFDIMNYDRRCIHCLESPCLWKRNEDEIINDVEVLYTGLCATDYTRHDIAVELMKRLMDSPTHRYRNGVEAYAVPHCFRVGLRQFQEADSQGDPY